MANTVERKLYNAAGYGRVAEVMSLLRDNPGLNDNWANGQWTALHAASCNDYVEVVKALLAHTHISVNMQDSDGRTPLSFGCLKGYVSIVRVLLKDPRVNIALDDEDGCTPLWHASSRGNHEVVEWLIASGRDLGDVSKKGRYAGIEYTVIEIASKGNLTKVVSLLEKFLANPAQTRYKLRVKLGLLDECAAEVFALTIFMCDGLLQLKPALASATSNPAATAATRFFTIASKLPMELQMLLCHRVVDSMKQNVLHRDSEAAFRQLARTLLLPPQSELSVKLSLGSSFSLSFSFSSLSFYLSVFALLFFSFVYCFVRFGLI